MSSSYYSVPRYSMDNPHLQPQPSGANTAGNRHSGQFGTRTHSTGSAPQTPFVSSLYSPGWDHSAAAYNGGDKPAKHEMAHPLETAPILNNSSPGEPVIPHRTSDSKTFHRLQILMNFLLAFGGVVLCVAVMVLSFYAAKNPIIFNYNFISQNLSIYNALLGLLGALIGLLGSASIGIIAIAFTIHRLRSPGGAKPLMIDFASSPGLQKTLDALAAGWDAGKLLWMLLLLLALNQLANSSINGLLVATPIDDEAIILVPYPTLAGRPSRLRRFEAAYQMLKGNTSANLDEAPFDSLPMEIPFIYDAATSVAGDNSVAGLDRSLTRGPNTAYLQDTHQLVNGMATSGSDLTGIASIWRQVELFPEILDTVSNGIPGFKRLLGEDATTVRSCAPVTDITMTCDSSWQPGRRTVNYEWCSETVQPWTPSEEYASDASADACTYRDGTPSFVLGVYANTSLTIEEQASDFTPQAGTYLHTCNVTLAESIRLIEVPLNVTTGISRQESRILNTAVVGKECTEYAAPGRPSVASDVTLSLLHGLATYFSYEFSLVSRSSSLLPVPTPMSTVLRRAQVGYQERNITQAGRLDQEMMTAVLVKSLGVMVNGVYGQTLTSTDFVDMLNDGSAQRYRTSLVRPGYAINPNGVKLLWTLPLLVIAIYSAVAAVLAFKSSSRRINLNSASTLLDLGVKSEARYAQVDVQPVAWRIDEKPDGRFSATQIMV